MVGVHLSMPDMLDGCGVLAQAEMQGVWTSENYPWID